MIRSLICCAALGAGLVATPVLATEQLSFRNLEFDQPRDPLVGSNVVFADVHHSPADQLEPALTALTAAVPAGTSLADGKAVLEKAGAHCDASATCRYRDVETVDENLDDVVWTVKLTGDDHKVAGLTVDRAWQRH